MALSAQAEKIFYENNATPLSDLALSGLQQLRFLPGDKISLPEELSEVLENIGVTDLSSSTEIHDDGKYTSQAEVQLLFARELSFGIPGLDGCSLVVGSNDGAEGTSLQLGLEWGDKYQLSVGGKLALRFARNLLKPVKRETASGPWVEIKDKSSEISIDTTVRIDGEGNISFAAGGLTLMPSMIGDSGVVVSFEGVTLVLSDDLSHVKDLPSPLPDFLKKPGWRGVYIGKATLSLPPSLETQGFPKLECKDCYIGSGGFTGAVSADWSTTPETTLFGIKAKLKHAKIGFIQNAFTQAEIEATLTLPFFDHPADVLVGFTLDGSVAVRLKSSNGLITLHKDGILDFKLESLGFKVEQGVFSVQLGGELTPLFAGYTWPGFRVETLSIDSQGNVHLDGGWLNLRNKYALDFHGFQFEVSQLGFGRNDDGSRWVGFSGAIRLVDALPAGASVEGLRFTWYDDGTVDVSFKGIGVELEIPEVLRFKGAVAYVKQKEDGKEVHRFDGDISLDIMAIGLEIDGKLVIGFREDYSFFAIYLGVELPAGIPLWATGLAIYGMAGLFAMNMEPDKKKEEEWYGALAASGGWYVRPPIGVTDLPKKWRDTQGALAVGAGITIGTVYDNGFTFSCKLLLVLVFPGPILLLEGKSNFLKERSKLDGEPVFRTLLVLDFREGSFLFGLGVDYKYGGGGELVELGGSAEVYFNTARADAWHLWIGKDEPRDKRIRAQIFRLWGADFYLMVDNDRFAMGSWTGYDADWSFGPVGITLEAWLEWNVRVNFKPAQIHGDVWAHGKIGVRLGPFGLGLSVDARLEADVFHPFHILGILEVTVDLPWPLPDFGFGIQVEWGPDPVPPPLPNPLLEIALEHPKASISWPLPAGQLVLPVFETADKEPGAGFLADELIPGPDLSKQPPPAGRPIVPLDVRPCLTFGRPVHDVKRIGATGAVIQNPNPEYELIGDPEKKQGPVEVRFGLEDVVFHTWDDRKRDWISTSKPVYGAWAPVPRAGTGGAADQCKLALWQKNPFWFCRRSTQAWGEWFLDIHCGGFYPCPPLPENETSVVCNFEGEAPARALRSPWGFTGQPRMRLHWEPEQRPEVEERRIVPGFLRVLSVTHTTRLQIVITLPEPANQVLLHLDAATAGSPRLTVSGLAADGTEKYPSRVESSHTIGVDAKTERMVGVILRREPDRDQEHEVSRVTETCLAQIRAVRRLAQEEIDERKEREGHSREEMRRWVQDGEVFLPDTTYRMTVKTSVIARGRDSLADFRRNLTLTQYAYFETQGPPGLAQLSRPANVPAGDKPQLPSAETFDEKTMGGLAGLGLYVHQTVPPTVAAEGEKPLLPRPVYRGYDVGVEYNETYVELMYRLAGRDLGLYLYDNNSRPVRGLDGRLAAPVNRWGRVEEVRLTETDSFWLKRKNDRCAPLDGFDIRRESRLDSGGQLLAADTLYQARLVPMLLHDDFRHYVVDPAKPPKLSGPSGAIGLWTLRDEPKLPGEFDTQSYWEVERVGMPDGDMFFMVQTSPYSQGGPDKPAALLWYDAAKPESWSDVRLSASLLTKKSRASSGDIGLAFRYHRDTSGKASYYLFSMGLDRDPALTFRRLARVTGDRYQILGQKEGTGYEPDKEYAVVIEAIGDEIRVYLDGQLLFLHREQPSDLLEYGSVGLYARTNRGARFGDVRVEDFRRDAPVSYRYGFTTSKYVDFFHQAHSFQDEVWSVPVTADLSAALARAVDPSADPTLAEAQAYEALAQQVLGAAALQLPAEVQVARLERRGDDRTDVLAFLVQSPEPFDFKRLSLGLRRAVIYPPPFAAPGEVKLTGATWADAGGDLNGETLALLLRETTDLSGCGIEVRGLFPGDPDADLPWLRYHTFGSEAPLPAGTRVILYAGKPPATAPPVPWGVVHRYLLLANDSPLRFPRNGFEARLVGGGGHRRAFVNGSLYRSVMFWVLRKADGTGFLLVPQAGTTWDIGLYDLHLSFRRDNRASDPTSLVLKKAGDSSPEEVSLCLVQAL